MSWTKRQFIEQAFEEIGLASYVFDLQPEQLASAMRRLDAMIAFWNTRGIRIGYPLPSTPNAGSLDSESGVPDSANQAVILNLAVQLAPSFGKTVSPDTKLNAKEAFKALMSLSTTPSEMQLPSMMPAGAGNKYAERNREFLADPKDPLQTGNDGELEFE